MPATTASCWPASAPARWPVRCCCPAARQIIRTLLRIATLLVAAALIVLAAVRNAPLAVLMCFGTGIGWIVALTTLGATVQSVLPDWVRAAASRCISLSSMAR